MYTWVIQLIISLVATAISYALTPSPQKPSPGKIQNLPIADQGAPIPVLFGTRIIKRPNVVWWGDVRTEPVKAKGK